MKTRQLLAALYCAVALAPAVVGAQAYPSRPVNLVVPFPPGGPTDAMARLIASHLKDGLGQPTVVENRGGAGGNIGAEYVARAPADGQTLLFGTSGPLAINVSLYRRIQYHPLKDFAPVIFIGYLPNVIVTHPAVPAKNVGELIALAKAKPGQLSFASSGNGASSHLAGVLFNNMAGTKLLHVPYKGTGPALIALLGGQVSMTFTDVLTAQQYVKSGRLRAIAVTTLARSRALPDTPTVSEQGLQGFDVSVFFGVVAPAATPAAVVGKVNKALAAVLALPEVSDTLAQQGLEASDSATPQHLAAFMKAEVAKWADIVQRSGAQLD